MVSIVIPTYNHAEDCLKPCVRSILQYTTDFECIIVANGCQDSTSEFLNRLDDRFKIVWFDQPIGYPQAINAGIRECSNEHIILLNNDVVLLPQERNEWVRQLVKPMTDPNVYVTGPMKSYNEDAKQWFIIFFCACVRRVAFGQLGLLDEIFSPGFGEDVDFCAKVNRAQKKIVQVPGDNRDFSDNAHHFQHGGFPIFHRGKTTFSTDVQNADLLLKANGKLLANRWAIKEQSSSTVMVEVCTRNRLRTTLPLAIMSILMQTRRPNHLVIFDDGPHEDVREDAVYKHIFTLLSQKGISWEWKFCEGKGQVASHQMAIDISTHDFIWRVDDDDVPEPDVLEKLLKCMTPDVGAAASRVLMPGQTTLSAGTAAIKIEDIAYRGNLQWCDFSGRMDVDHLHNTFLFRRSAASHGYPKGLSVVGHREETIFSYEMKRNGWRLIVESEAVTWHLKSPSGGIRSFNDSAMYDADEMVFRKYLDSHKVNLRSTVVICLNNGLGDHFAFKMVLPEIKQKNVGKRIMLAVCYPEVFVDDKDIDVVSIRDGQQLIPNQEQFDVYRWMWLNGHRESLCNAYRKMYLL